MKIKKLLLLLALVCTLLVCGMVSASAANIQHKDGLYYIVNDDNKTARIVWPDNVMIENLENVSQKRLPVILSLK